MKAFVSQFMNVSNECYPSEGGRCLVQDVIRKLKTHSNYELIKLAVKSVCRQCGAGGFLFSVSKDNYRFRDHPATIWQARALQKLKGLLVKPGCCWWDGI